MLSFSLVVAKKIHLFHVFSLVVAHIAWLLKNMNLFNVLKY